jgi:hypothetical protein
VFRQKSAGLRDTILLELIDELLAQTGEMKTSEAHKLRMSVLAWFNFDPLHRRRDMRLHRADAYLRDLDARPAQFNSLHEIPDGGMAGCLMSFYPWDPAAKV